MKCLLQTEAGMSSDCMVIPEMAEKIFFAWAKDTNTVSLKFHKKYGKKHDDIS